MSKNISDMSYGLTRQKFQVKKTLIFCNDSVAGTSSATSMFASSWTCTVSPAKDFTNIIFVITIVVEWLGLINWPLPRFHHLLELDPDELD
jgi:hypothetical protein